MANEAPAPPMRPSPRPATTAPVKARSYGWLMGWGLAGLALLTRAPLAGGNLGEPDCARYLVGLAQWMQHGATAPFIYGKVFSPLYYVAAAWTVGRTGWPAPALLSQASLWAAVLSAPLLFWLGSRLTSRPVAAAGTVLFLMAPGFWWLGIEPHPQGVSFLFLLLALWASAQGDAASMDQRRRRGRSWTWRIAAAIAFSIGLLLKNDLILFAAVFPALNLRFGPVEDSGPGTRRRAWRRAAQSLAAPVGGGLAFLLLRPVLLGIAWTQLQRQTHSAVLEFLEIPHGVGLIKQILPMLTAPGVALVLVTLAGVILGCSGGGSDAQAWRRRWGWPMLAWAGPPILFWGLIQGNNDRHMAAYILLPAWAALEALTLGAGLWVRRKHTLTHRRRHLLPHRLRGVQLAWICVIVIVANLALVPPSSNTSLYASADVPESAHDLTARMHELRGWLDARQNQTAAGRAACYLGNATLPFMEWDLLERDHAQGPLPLPGFGTGPALRIQAGRIEDRFIEVNTPAEYQRAAERCRRSGAGVHSLEYTPQGLHKQFLGREWRTLPFAGRWYPGGR